MNEEIITSERLKQLEGMEQLYATILTENITLKAKSKALEERVVMLKTELNLLRNGSRTD